MNSKASGRSALILATGLWIGFAGPSLAAGDATASSKPNAAASSTAINNSAKRASRHLKKYAHQKSAKVADKSADKKAGSPTTGDADNSPPVPSIRMPVSIANANAQLPATDTPAGSAQAMSDRANTILQAAPGSSADAQPATGAPVVAADQLNEVDRALHATTVALASADAPAVMASPPLAAAASNENSTWDQTSLIGKIFIGFGALLTMASAARMFMA
ncbi:MAG: hypothetical protein ABI192_01305 [Bradyrhizobium sp.]